MRVKLSDKGRAFKSLVLDDGLITVDFSAHRVDCSEQLRDECAQLVRCQFVGIGRGVHAADCARAVGYRLVRSF